MASIKTIESLATLTSTFPELPTTREDRPALSAEGVKSNATYTKNTKNTNENLDPTSPMKILCADINKENLYSYEKNKCSRITDETEYEEKLFKRFFKFVELNDNSLYNFTKKSNNQTQSNLKSYAEVIQNHDLENNKH